MIRYSFVTVEAETLQHWLQNAAETWPSMVGFSLGGKSLPACSKMCSCLRLREDFPRKRCAVVHTKTEEVCDTESRSPAENTPDYLGGQIKGPLAHRRSSTCQTGQPGLGKAAKGHSDWSLCFHFHTFLSTCPLLEAAVESLSL